MTPKPGSRPTDAELEILQVLWQQGPSTVRQIHDVLSEQRGVGYTTVLKLLQIMAEKQLVERDESQRSHVYSPRQRQEQTQLQLVKDLIGRAFGGATNRLVMKALEADSISPNDIDEIRSLLDELEGNTR